MINKKPSLVWFVMLGFLVAQRMIAGGPEVKSSQDVQGVQVQKASKVPQLPQEVWTHIFDLGLQGQRVAFCDNIVPTMVALHNKKIFFAIRDAAAKNLNRPVDYECFVKIFGCGKALDIARKMLFSKDGKQRFAAQNFLCGFYPTDMQDFVFESLFDYFKSEELEDCDSGCNFVTNLIMLNGDSCAARLHSKAVHLCAERATRVAGLKLYCELVTSGYYKEDAAGQACASALTNDENICFWSLRLLREAVDRGGADVRQAAYSRALGLFASLSGQVRAEALCLMSDCVVGDPEHRGIAQFFAVICNELVSADDCVYRAAVKAIRTLVLANYGPCCERVLEEALSERLESLDFNLAIELILCLVAEGYAQAFPRALVIIQGDERLSQSARLGLACELARNGYAGAYQACASLVREYSQNLDPVLRKSAIWMLVHLVRNEYPGAHDIAIDVLLNSEGEEDEGVRTVITMLDEVIGGAD